jgi:hypothetical protein
MGNIDGDVADYFDPSFMRISMKLLPLLEEFILPVLVSLYFERQADATLVNRIGIPPGNIGWPAGPRDMSMCLFTGHEQREIIEPVGIVLAKFLEVLMFWCIGRLEELPGCAFKKWEFESAHAAVVDRIIGHCGSNVEISLAQKSFLHQRIEVDEQGIAGAGREALKWRVPVTSRIQRQHLPQFVTGSGEKIQKTISFGAEVANAMGAGQ